MAIDTKQTEISLDEHVVILSGNTFGMGSFAEGMQGTVVRKSPHENYSTVYYVNVEGVGNYQCLREDICYPHEVPKQTTFRLRNFLSKQLAHIQADITTQETVLKGYQDSEPTTDDDKYKREVGIKTTLNRIKSLKRIIQCTVPQDKHVYNTMKQRFEKLYSRNDTLTLVTKPVDVSYRMANGDTIHVPLGTFRVSCNFRTRQTSFATNGDNTSYEGRYHPHLSQGTTSSPCWGSYSDMVTKCYKTLDIISLMALILDFLNSCSRSGWYCSIVGFAMKQQAFRDEYGHICERCEHEDCECDETCGDCGNHYDDCTCNTCSECGYHMDDCECLRCPDSGDRLAHDAFPDSLCMRCSECYRNEDAGEWQCTYNGEDYPDYITRLEDYTPPEGTIIRYRTLTDGVLTERSR